jgi:hypothetical protein
MKQLLNELAVSEMLAAKHAVLFFWVDWSNYAKRGTKLVEAAEAQFASECLAESVSWWTGDFSSTDSPIDRVIHRWLIEQDQKGTIQLFPNIAMGSGSIIWISSGDILSFAASAMNLELDGIVQRTASVFK